MILIETEMKCSATRLFAIMESRFRMAYETRLQSSLPNSRDGSQSNAQVSAAVRRFARECMKSLLVYKCCSGEELVLALAACEQFIKSHVVPIGSKPSQPEACGNITDNGGVGTITPIFVDTINANFEVVDKYNGQLESAGASESNRTESYSIVLVRP